VGLGNGGSPLFFTSAFLWSGTAESVVKLGDGFAFANAIRDGQQVGATGDNVQHALLWTGSAQSVVDLHPSGFSETVARGVAAGRQVGWGTSADGSTHALLWKSTANSVVDLHVFLPATFVNSKATGIDASGNIIGTADGHPILWVRQ